MPRGTNTGRLCFSRLILGSFVVLAGAQSSKLVSCERETPVLATGVPRSQKNVVLVGARKAAGEH